MNLVLVTSVINTKHSFFSSEERLKQTIELTIPSIRNKILNTYIVILEGSNVSDEQKNKLEKVCDEIFYVDLGGSDKQSGEINLLYRYLTSEIFSEKKNKIENLLKISGRYYINNNPSKVIDCCYDYSPTLYNVAKIINNLDNHKVNINIKHWDMAPPFNGEFTDLGLQFIGLEQGIKNVYNKLKNEY